MCGTQRGRSHNVLPLVHAMAVIPRPSPTIQVRQALTANGVRSVGLSQRGRGARDAVAQFKTDPSVSVFLLTLQVCVPGFEVCDLWLSEL